MCALGGGVGFLPEAAPHASANRATVASSMPESPASLLYGSNHSLTPSFRSSALTLASSAASGGTTGSSRVDSVLTSSTGVGSVTVSELRVDSGRGLGTGCLGESTFTSCDVPSALSSASADGGEATAAKGSLSPVLLAGTTSAENGSASNDVAAGAENGSCAAVAAPNEDSPTADENTSSPVAPGVSVSHAAGPAEEEGPWLEANGSVSSEAGAAAKEASKGDGSSLAPNTKGSPLGVELSNGALKASSPRSCVVEARGRGLANASDESCVDSVFKLRARPRTDAEFWFTGVPWEVERSIDSRFICCRGPLGEHLHPAGQQQERTAADLQRTCRRADSRGLSARLVECSYRL